MPDRVDPSVECVCPVCGRPLGVLQHRFRRPWSQRLAALVMLLHRRGVSLKLICRTVGASPDGVRGLLDRVNLRHRQIRVADEVDFRPVPGHSALAVDLQEGPAMSVRGDHSGGSR